MIFTWRLCGAGAMTRNAIGGLLGLFAVLYLSSTANAATYKLTATLAPSYETSIYAGFDVVYNDVNSNNLLEYSEILSFSGWSYRQPYTPDTHHYSTILLVPTVSGFTTCSGPGSPGTSPGSPQRTCPDYSLFWMFDNPDDPYTIVIANFVWTYSVEAVASPTPLPAALPLFASGLGVMGLLGWRRKRKKAGA
jgi:hypothetical protein